LVLEMLNRCAEKPICFGKSIVRPERVSHCTDPHRMWYHAPYFHVDTKRTTFDWTPLKVADDKLLLYHYYMGDIDHAINVTLPRRSRWIGLTPESYLENHEHLNACENNSMGRFTKKLHFILNAR
jgi:hypothetical protein